MNRSNLQDNYSNICSNDSPLPGTGTRHIWAWSLPSLLRPSLALETMEISPAGQRRALGMWAESSPSQLDRDEVHLEVKCEEVHLVGNEIFQLLSRCNSHTVSPLLQRHQHGQFHSQIQTAVDIHKSFVLHTDQIVLCTSANCHCLPLYQALW